MTTGTKTKIERIAATGLMALALLVCASVVLRYLFNWPIPDTLDLSRIFLGMTVFWGIALAFVQGSHIQVDLLWDHLGPPARRAVTLFNRVLLLLFALLFAWLVVEHLWHLLFNGKQTVDLRLPLWLFHLFFVPACIIPLWVCAKRLFGNTDEDKV